MRRQFDTYTTFFDLGMDHADLPFCTLEYCSGGFNKKRAHTNRIIWKRLTGQELSVEESIQADKFIQGIGYAEQKKKFEHCALCSDSFTCEPLVEFSKKFNYWDLAFPTSPYTPAGIMIYLKERKRLKLENIDALSKEAFKEIKLIAKSLFHILKNEIHNLCGVNILFHQISTSQACLHGHLELMIHNIDSSLGCFLKKQRPFDICANYLNNQLEKKDDIYFFTEGIRLNSKFFSTLETMRIIKEYRNNTVNLFNFFSEVRKSYFSNISEQKKAKETLEKRGFTHAQIDQILFDITPAPINCVYFTYYRDEYFISIIPELILKSIPLTKIRDDEYLLYNLKYNAIQPREEKFFLEEKHPLIRPSIKLKQTMPADKKIFILKQTVQNLLSKERL